MFRRVHGFESKQNQNLSKWLVCQLVSWVSRSNSNYSHRCSLFFALFQDIDEGEIEDGEYAWMDIQSIDDVEIACPNDDCDEDSVVVRVRSSARAEVGWLVGCLVVVGQPVCELIACVPV